MITDMPNKAPEDWAYFGNDLKHVASGSGLAALKDALPDDVCAYRHVC